ncbi:cerebellin-2-like isoform X2 [Mya arenaria]|uniref:cerebellin-2-like isoform X2 n=1 Tax=Mya arenaria TaxID=6604 RepID=UPI0022E394E1|nr:cerebellin-2-like isoform X2 [Mya arenaria]
MFAFLLCILSARFSFAFTDEEFKALVERIDSLESQIIAKDLQNTDRLQAQEEETARLRAIIKHQNDVIAGQQKVDVADNEKATGDKTPLPHLSVERNASVHRGSRFVAEGPVAFTATKSSSQSHIGIKQNILFEKIVLNLGGGYHPDHGLFIAPVPGVYMFSTSLLSFYTGSVELHADLVHNGNVINRVYGHGDSGRHAQGSQTAVLQLQVSDEVWVRNIDYNDESVYGGAYSSFCGSLLYPN